MVFDKIISRINLEKHKANITFYLKRYGKCSTYLSLNITKTILKSLTSGVYFKNFNFF
jgi:hypothetical protein